MAAPVELRSGISAASAMSTEGQRVDDSPSTSGGSSDGDQREGVQQEQEREQVQPKKKEGKISSKTAAKLSTSAKRMKNSAGLIMLYSHTFIIVKEVNPAKISKTLKQQSVVTCGFGQDSLIPV
ncbi:ubiquitin-conjugating enzyme E2 E2 isoform X5 [Willisornis vidua]|uniref:Ubiquitin-conjugating enzyme E2 E2 isoform X5 n=1 Tax=Willisornis vidua TaxID=1566151 RepID=A0ABQ9D6Q4_9PASS|nr:ubiquitin-conjugating enzyme E2 E2 isoform X5 [Willisornis vidua]